MAYFLFFFEQIAGTLDMTSAHLGLPAKQNYLHIFSLSQQEFLQAQEARELSIMTITTTTTFL